CAVSPYSVVKVPEQMQSPAGPWKPNSMMESQRLHVAGAAGSASSTLSRPRSRGLRCRHLQPPMLLRKEVIQPHVPVGLPCYDFTPVTSPTFDGSLPCGLGHRLRVLPAPMV